MRSTIWRVGFVPVLVSMLGACAGGGNALTRYYVIDPVEVGSATTLAADLSVEILDLDVPQYLERFHIATRTETSGVEYADLHQWSETLRKNLIRTLSVNLSRQLGTAEIYSPLNRSLSRPDVRVKVHVDRFERGADGMVYLDAHWQVARVDSGRISATQSASLAGPSQVPKGDYDQMVTVMRDLFGELSGDIARSIVSETGTM